MHVRIEEVACHLPDRVETGEALLRDNPDWQIEAIEGKTGVLRRHIAAEGEDVLELAARAAEAIFARGVAPAQIDGLVLVTSTPGQQACALQHRLQLPRSCMVFSVGLACSGAVYGLGIAASLIESSLAGRVLLLCSDTWTRLIGRHDRTCRPLFSDGAAAVLVARSEQEAVGPFVFGTDGSGSASLLLRYESRCGACETPSPQVFMDGGSVLLFSMAEVPRIVAATLEKAGLQREDIDLFVFHQGSKLVLDNIVRRLKLPEEKVYRNYQHRGNTVAAAIPVALHDAAAEGRLRPGARVLLVGFGLGLSSGAVVIRWTPGSDPRAVGLVPPTGRG